MMRRRAFAVFLAGFFGFAPPVHADSDDARQNARPPSSAHGCVTYYPDLSRRLGETGDVVVGYDIGADGALANLRVIYSSGFARLDQAALACIAAAPHAAPLIKDGAPVASPGHQAIISYALTGVTSAERAFQHGMAQEAMGDHARAIEAFSQAIAMDADDAEAYRARARAYEASGQHDLAAADTAKADALGGAR